MSLDEIIQALTSISEHHTRAQREILQLMLRLQREGIAASAALSQNAHEEGSQPDVVSAVSVAPVAVDPQRKPTRTDALTTAKEVLKEKLRDTNPDNLLHLVDKVWQSDLDATRSQSVSPTPIGENRSAANHTANVEFFRNYFNAQTMEGGRGPVGRGMFGLKQYHEDVRFVRQADLRKNWPSGFYTDQTTAATQFMINQPDIGRAILIEGLPRGDFRVSVLYYTNEEFASFVSIVPPERDERVRVLLANSFREAFQI